MFRTRCRSLLLVLLLVPSLAAAQASPVSRREGFLLIWNAIRRPAFPAPTAFSDLPQGAPGAFEIDYAVERGLLDDQDDRFRPDDPLTVADAQLWLLRTRNVEPVDAEGNVKFLQIADPEHVPELARMYGLDVLPPGHLLTQEELTSLMQQFDERLAALPHETSLYGEEFHGKRTAFGETFDMHALTAAHRSFPHNTLVEVTNLANGKSVTVRINDRGPFVQGRDMDLSLAAFRTIEDRSKGVITATYRRVGDASLVPDVCAGAEAGPRQRRITRDVRFHRGVPHRWGTGHPLLLSANRSFVVRGITYPDGTSVRLQEWVLPGEQFTFTPAVAGAYVLRIGTAAGRVRALWMHVESCGGG